MENETPHEAPEPIHRMTARQMADRLDMTTPYRQLSAAGKAKRYRLVEGLSQAQMARLIGLNESSVGYIERGERSPGRKASQAYKRVVGIPVDAWDKEETP